MAIKKPAISSNKSTVTKPKTVEATASSKQAKNSIVTKFETFCDSLQNKPIVGAMIAEFIGTFLLTAAFLEMQSSPLFVAFAVVGIVLIVGGISGAHINPAITIGAWITGKVRGARAIGYIFAQLLGAGAALLVLHTFLDASSASTTSTLYSAATIPSGKEWYLFFAELLGAAILGLGFATGLQHKHNKAAFAFTVGLATLTALYIAMSLSTVLLTASYTGLTFLNPAIALVAGGLSWKIWPIAIFIIAPALGAIIGFVLQTLMHRSQPVDDCECSCCKN